MDTKKLEKWANLLLDTGKRNNLINFKDTKASTVEVVSPDVATIFEKLKNESTFEVYDPKNVDTEFAENNVEGESFKRINRDQYIANYSAKLNKNNQILLYNGFVSPVNALKNIDKKARTYMEETGVSVAYMAFGFIHWKESENSQYEYKAPILLVPITFKNDSAVEPWFIDITEDDIVVNPTFNFKLQSEHGVCLPEYNDEGLVTYIDKITEIVSKLGWTVSTECKIGIFSFLKMNMYQDLKSNQDRILDNNNVRMLLGESFEKQGVSIDGGEHHLENSLIELHNVIDADSSQIEAIELAKSGVSFVLQGPPGTGKSQTITNIIAECLHDGKKVLFVSEKQAALNVVYDKLKKVGLEEFCLELHSYKANKKDVIDNLCHTLRLSKTTVSEKATQEIEEKKKNQKELDEYETELHKPREVINRTLYQLYNDYAACRKAPDIKYPINNLETKGEEYRKDCIGLLRQYVDFVPTIGYQYKNNPWYGYVNLDTSYQNKEKLKDALEQMISVLAEFEELRNQIKFDYDIECNSLKQTVLWENFFQLAGESTILTPAFFKKSACSYILQTMQELENLAKDIVTIQTELKEEYDEEIFKLNADENYKKLTRQFTNVFTRLFNSEYKKIVNDVRLCHKQGKKMKYEALTMLMQKVQEFQAKTAKFSEIETPIRQSMGAAYVGVDSDWEAMIEQIRRLMELFDEGAVFAKLELFSECDYENNKTKFNQISEKLSVLYEKIKLCKDILTGSFDKEIFDLERTEFSKAREKLQRCLDDFEHIDNWCSFNNLLNKMKKQEVLSFIDVTIENNIASEDIVLTYLKNFYFQWIDHVQHLTPVLTYFNRVSHDKAVDDFCKEDETQFTISRAQIKSELSANRPSLNLISSGSAVSILLREGEKKRKQKSIRKLLEETGELVQMIKPCFLMSPLSVSTFLSANAINFDVVIFDEASQIFPQDAIGAIYRGKQLIVVGDSKQMPPSNFFNASVEAEDSDEETGDITDFESILDLCSTVLPQLRLKWHYRSRFEQLITFSNKNFYDNDLITFPSSKTDSQWSGVDYYYVDGVFDHKARNNRAEAEFVVDLIFKNIERFPDRSLGVVAFSVAQQDLIERLLSKRREADSSKEFFFRKDVAEPFFVKNLETVQGDERDTIIFSVAYAKDSNGRLLHNFGPLNRVGGERRLNVAVTRAKMNVQLVSSMHHTDIDLKRTQAEGAKLLREYLDYAENGTIALERAISVNAYEQFDSEFELEVCEFLRERGFSVDTQVGCSNFRIDLGLKKPNTSDYVLAIECDGATYHSSSNARDRDRLRQQILEGMGWKFYRIWSTDWFKNTAIEKERLLKAVIDAVQGTDLTLESNVQSIDESEKQEEVFEEAVQEEHFSFPVYKEADIHQLANSINAFQPFIKEILKMEAPLSEEWLLKRIVWMFGREKVTNVVQKEYEAKMHGCSRNGIIRRNGFLYLQDMSEYMLRVPGDGDKREIKYIAKEELAAGLLTVIKQNVTADKEGLYRYVAKELGFNRLGDAINNRFDEALGMLSSSVDVKDNIVSMKNEL